jgi:uncharacterized membrane protein YqaE (UPF0057 family)
MILIAILFPALSFFLRGKIFAAIIALLLQCTLIGWLPVAIWAVVSRSNAKNDQRIKQMEQTIIAAQNNK